MGGDGHDGWMGGHFEKGLGRLVQGGWCGL